MVRFWKPDEYNIAEQMHCCMLKMFLEIVIHDGGHAFTHMGPLVFVPEKQALTNSAPPINSILKKVDLVQYFICYNF